MENSRAREYFERMRNVARRLEEATMELDEIASGDTMRGISYDMSVSGHMDMADRIIAAMDSMQSTKATIRKCEQELDAATVVLYGRDGHGGVARALGYTSADVVCCHYLMGESYTSIAERNGFTEANARYHCGKVMAYLDENPSLLSTAI